MFGKCFGFMVGEELRNVRQRSFSFTPKVVTGLFPAYKIFQSLFMKIYPGIVLKF